MKEKNIEISPSILAADFTDIKGLVKDLENAGADWLHLDVMDGRFVPNISFGPKMVEDINKLTKLPLDVHLMIQDPINYIDKFADAGSDIITVHFEATDDLRRDLEKIRSRGVLAGVSVKPATPVAVLKEYLPFIDLILIMSVEPGFGGQKFMPQAIEKVKETKKMIDSTKYDIIIQIDGGITNENAPAVIGAGCSMIVSGSFITSAKDKKAAIASLKEKA